MVNTINEFQERNKQLLEENENLKKQLTDKEQEFKLRILNAVNNVMENERSEIAGTLMTLQQHFWAWDEWVKVQKENGVEKATFSNEFTFENIVKALLNEPCLVVILSVMFLNKIKNLRKRILF